jgi:hypothetical protein
MGQMLVSWRESKGTARPAEANANRAKASAAIRILILLLGVTICIAEKGSVTVNRVFL